MSEGRSRLGTGRPRQGTLAAVRSRSVSKAPEGKLARVGWFGSSIDCLRYSWLVDIFFNHDMSLKASIALGVGIWCTSRAQSNAPILTGLTRHSGQVRAFFLTPDRQTTFALGLGSEWGDYRLLSVDFTNRSAVVEERKQLYITHFGSSGAEPVDAPAAEVTRFPKRRVFPFTPEEEEYRALHGQAAFTKWQQERLLEKIEAEGRAGSGAIRPEVVGEGAHP